MWAHRTMRSAHGHRPSGRVVSHTESAGMRMLPANLQRGCAYCPYSPDSRLNPSTARAAQRHAANQPSAARTCHREGQSPDWVTGRLTPGQVPRAASRPVPHLAHQRAGRRTGAPRRNPARERRSASAAPGAGLTPSTRRARAAPSRRQRRRGPGQRAPLLGAVQTGWDDQRGQTTCKCGNSLRSA